MAEEGTKKKKGDTFLEQMVDKIHDSDSETTAYRLFGRKKPVHKVFGGGKPADVFLWRDKKVSAGVLGGVTAIWVLFDVLEYHLLTLVSHGLILALAVSFLWSNATTFINKSPPRIPKIDIPEDPVLKLASALRIEINQAGAFLRDVALGKDLKMFLCVIAGLWVLSLVGSCCDFLTLLYISNVHQAELHRFFFPFFQNHENDVSQTWQSPGCPNAYTIFIVILTGVVLLFTVPVFYEKYENQVDSFAEKTTAELKKQYDVFDANVLSKIPRGQLKDKKRV